EIEAFLPALYEVRAISRHGNHLDQIAFVHEREIKRRKGACAVTRVALGELPIRRMVVDEPSVVEPLHVVAIESPHAVLIAHLPEDLPSTRVKPVPNLDRRKPDRLDRSGDLQVVG